MKVKIVLKSSKEISPKGNGRIFVQTIPELKKVHDIIKEMDEDEYEEYMPKDFITVFNEDENRLIYTNKFDIEVGELLKKCEEEGIYVLVYSCNYHNFDDSLTLETAVAMKLGEQRWMDDFTYNKTKDW